MSKHILGVHPVGAGFQKCRIEPSPGFLEWAKGVFPSVRGDIQVEWKRDAGKFTLDTVIPEGLETDLVLPRRPAEKVLLNHNGTSYEIRPGAKSLAGLRLTETTISIKVTGGNHHVAAVGQAESH
jgi:hypothetical protein